MSIKEYYSEIKSKVDAAQAFTSENGDCKVKESLYFDCLPEDLSKEVVEKVKQYDSAFLPAAANAFGQVAIDDMKKNKDLSQVKVSIPLVGKDTFEVVMDRKNTYSNSISGGDPVTHYGTMRATLNTWSAETSHGEMKKVREELRTMAKEAFGKL